MKSYMVIFALVVVFGILAFIVLLWLPWACQIVWGAEDVCDTTQWSYVYEIGSKITKIDTVGHCFYTGSVITDTTYNPFYGMGICQPYRLYNIMFSCNWVKVYSPFDTLLFSRKGFEQMIVDALKSWRDVSNWMDRVKKLEDRWAEVEGWLYPRRSKP